MKILYFGGQKSGKSKLAEQKALELTQKNQPFYIATYDNSFGDSEMSSRIDKHKLQRLDKFITIEQSQDISTVVQNGNSYLVDCVSMLILNNLDKSEDELLAQFKAIAKIDANIVFVLNDVNSGIIPLDEQSRKFVDMSGIIGQYIASFCDEVYEVKLGIGIKIK